MLVLPDGPEAAQIRVPWPAPRVISHASGRPWLVGRWAPEEVLLVSAGAVRVAVFGVCPIPATRLRDLCARVRIVRDLDAVARALPGSTHLVASCPDGVRVQGSVSGLRTVFHTTVQGVPVAADRADVLAALTRAEVDEQALAVRVNLYLPPPPLSELSLWRGVRVLRPDSYLLMAGDTARTREVRWWSPPAPEQSLDAGAATVRTALEDALNAHRLPPRGRLSADLSGGMDSSSLCFLATRHTPDLLTCRWAEADPANDDARYAGHAIEALPESEHLVLPQDVLPSLFAQPGQPAGTDAPYPMGRTLARVRHTVATLTEHGATRHLAGHGGDELFTAPLGHLPALLRRHPLLSLKQVRGYRAMGRWPLRATLTGLLRPISPRTWWHTQAATLTHPPAHHSTPDLNWASPLRAATWTTRAALEATQAALRHAGDHAVPDDARPILATLRTTGPVYRQLDQVFAADGLCFDIPYFDDRVIEAVLSVRVHEHSTPWHYKPLLAEAMHGVLPDAIRTRTTKGEFGEDVRIGLRHHQNAVLDLFADSALAEAGLIDPDTFRARVLTPHSTNYELYDLEQLLGCEHWLRHATTPTGPDYPIPTTENPASKPETTAAEGIASHAPTP